MTEDEQADLMKDSGCTEIAETFGVLAGLAAKSGPAESCNPFTIFAKLAAEREFDFPNRTLKEKIR